jgi:thymidine phosphorylase
VLRRRVGDAVAKGDSLATVHADSREHAALAREELRRAITILPGPAAPLKLMHAIVTSEGIEYL